VHPLSTALLSLAALASCCFAPTVAGASGCMRDIVVPIRFEHGAACWRHVGVGTTFKGQFAAHQHITASATGQFFNSDGKRTWMTTGPWQLDLTGPGGYAVSANDTGRLDTVLPRSGTYGFQIGPCAVWGNTGTVEICAR